MGLFEDLSQFLETRLEEFLRNNPHLELLALEESLQEQENETLQLLNDLRSREQHTQADILTTAQEVQRWHLRIEKAKAAGRLDLAQLAQERETALLREGNQRWGQMKLTQERLRQTEALLRQIQIRRQEVRAKAEQAKTAQESGTPGWSQRSHPNLHQQPDPLEEKFKRWETEDELEQMKRNLRR
jgi:uncharacterized protein (TIGR04376 family)